jgi:hypothetical protein
MTRKLLNSYQRNPVSITLRALETVMREAIAGLAVQQQGILYRQKTTLSRRQRDQLEQLSAAALDEISALAQALALPAEVRDTRSALYGQLVVLWSDLHDIRADKLAAYGEVSPDLQPVLDPPLLRLTELVRQMMDVIAQMDDHQTGN